MPSAKYDPNDGRLRGRKLQARRLRVWTKNPHCAMCGRLTVYPDGFHLDHIAAVHKVGEDMNDAAVQILCVHPCHDIKTASDMGIRYKQPIGEDGWPII
jgi:5-methylcytosine-specific restriction protein A